MRKQSATIGVISGLFGAMFGFIITGQPFMQDLAFGWQLVICTVLGALLGLLGGLIYRWIRSRTQSQQQ